jgi:hypothetical protein
MIGSKRTSPTSVREPIEASGLSLHVVVIGGWRFFEQCVCVACRLPINSNLSRYMDVTTNRH